MPFQFHWFCSLLDELDRNRHKCTLSISRAQKYEVQIVNDWYHRFSHRIERTGPSAIAFLSCVLPERRPDRVYNLQAKRLSQIFGRALGLGVSRAADLNRWRDRDGEDFPTCVELTLRECENETPPPGNEVTLEEINEALELIAAHSISSASKIRAKRTNDSATELLAPILRRLRSNEAKWLARMLLKTYAPVQVPEYQALHGFHFMLPNLLAIQNSFEAAVGVLATKAIRQLPARPDRNYEHALQSLVSSHVHPRTGVMVRRQPYLKARSIKNCCDIVNGRQMSVERKYDGEYCQIHVDMAKGLDCLQIFSKSGKDSTGDRVRLHSAIKDALRIGRNGCRIRRHCIIEGELLVWSIAQSKIQPFYKIRKYVKHGGRDIGTAQDSPRRPDEQLMVAFYDILVLDDHMLLNKSHKVRRQHLKMVLQTTEGRAILCEREVVDFRAGHAKERLRSLFAQSIAQRWEGLVLKGLNEPYFSWNARNHGVKLKKDYITSLGDTADLCIVGGRRDPHIELQIGLGRLEWTSFYVGAACNMDAIRRYDAKPRIKIIDLLTHHSMPKAELIDLNRLGKLVQTAYAATIDEFEVEMGRFDMEKPNDLFKRPFIVEIMGAGFEKPSNSAFWTLRFPRKTGDNIKIHTDRTLLDTVSFSELQEMAERSVAAPKDADSQEDAAWIGRLFRADGQKQNTDSVTQTMNSTETSGSLRTKDSSPIRPADKTPSFVFIRPDTEEPETQCNRDHVLSQRNSTDCGPEMTEKSGTINETKLASGRTSQGSNRRYLRTSTSITDKEPTSKRQCLRDVQTPVLDQLVPCSQATIEVTSSAVQETSAAQQNTEGRQVCMMAIADADEISSTVVISTTPPCTTSSFYSALESADKPLPTPDSTRVLRQILSFHDSSLSWAANLQATMTSPGRPVPVAEPAAGQPSSRPINDLLSVFPTPPTSSPPDGQRTTRRLSFSNGLQIQAAPDRPVLLPNIMCTSATTQPTDDHGLTPNLATRPAEAHIIRPTVGSPLQALRKSSPSTVLVFSAECLLKCPLTNLHVSLTFSVDHFISQVGIDDLSTPPRAHTNGPPQLILVDSLNPESMANSFRVMAGKMADILPPIKNQIDTDPDFPTRKLNNTILVFDVRILKHERIARRGGKLDTDVLRTLDFRKGHGLDASLFCGVLEVYERSIPVGEVESPRLGIRLDYRFDWLKRT